MKAVYQSRRLQTLFVQTNDIRVAVHFVVGQLVVVRVIHGGVTLQLETNDNLYQFRGEAVLDVLNILENSGSYKNLGSF